MARIDYYEIQNAIKTMLDADSTLSGVKNRLEALDIIAENCPQTVIILKSRNNILEEIAAGQHIRMGITFEVWCYEYALEILQAMKKRDDLIGKVEIALMKNRTLNSTVQYHTITGGEFENVQSANFGWISGGSIVLVAEQQAIT